LSLSYEPVTVTVEKHVERTMTSKGWVTKYRLIGTTVRVVVTKITYVLLSPDGKVEVSRYVLPTRYIETEYSLTPVTQYLGVVRLEEAIGATPPAEKVAPTPAPPATASPTRERAIVAV
jgi:hypothetical protein